MISHRIRRAGPVLLACALAAPACGPSLPDPAPDAEKLRQASLGAITGEGKHCTAQRKATEPDLFGWDSGSRGKVKATAEQGLVVVHFEEHGCDIAISVLNCTSSKASYRYTPRHAQQTRFAENDADLYAHFPVAVADLRGRLSGSRAIRADYRVEGIDMIPIGTSVGPGDLRGSECAEATHVVSAIHRGAFAVAASSIGDLRAGGSLFDGSLKQRLGVFDGDGFQEACDGARQKSTRTTGCDEPLRIELQPLLRGEEAHPSSPPPVVVTLPPASPPPIDPPDPPPRRSPRTAPAAPRIAVSMRATPAPFPPPIPPAPPEPRSLPAYKAQAPEGGCPAGMASIRGGVFTLGGEEERRNVMVEPYCLDVTEVTVGAYARCSSCQHPAGGPLCNLPGHGKDHHPQNCVSWEDARWYCAAAGKRLPTEAEWEFAARGGAEQRGFPWGDAAPRAGSACWNRWNLERGTCPVGAYPDGAFGLKDMAGNLWEWVDDWYGGYPGDAPADTPAFAGRVIRGGAWTSSSPINLRAGSRAATWPTNRDDYLGFRCAWSR